MTGSELTDVFPGDSAMARAMRAHDWSSSGLGHPRDWPEGLKVPIGMMLTSKFAMWLGWGEELCFFYNDAYTPLLGNKHPAALGRPMKDVWQEIYATLEPRIDSVMRDGIGTWDEALQLIIERHVGPEEAYFTFSYSPLRGDSGTIDGLMCVVSEETERVIGERRLSTLRTLATSLLTRRSYADVSSAVSTTLNESRRDFPFHAFYVRDTVVGDAEATQIAWPAGDLTGDLLVPLEGLFADPPRGAWDAPPREALVVPLTKSGQSEPVGTLVMGLNPVRPRHDDVASFARLITAQISGALSAIDAHESELMETERLRQLFEQSPSFMGVVRGPHHRFEFANAPYREISGNRDLIGRDVRDAFPEIEGQGFFELLDKVYRDGEPVGGQSVPVMVARDGSGVPEQRYIDFVYQPIRSSDGVVSGIFIEGYDVTERYLANAAVRESEAQFRTLAEAMRNHVWTARCDGYLDWFNGQVLAYSGKNAAELEGSGWAEMVHPEDIGATAERWAVALASGEDYDAEFRLRRHDGHYRWHIARGVAQRDDDGRILRWIGTNTDIHEQKEIAQKLSDLNATLEQQVEERTGALFAAEEALRHSQKLEAVGQLTGGIAHDFNNLLTVIRGSIEMIRAPHISEEKRERYLTAIADTADRAARLTAQLLAFARRQTLRPEVFDAGVAIKALSEMIVTLTGSTIRIRTHVPDEPLLVNADSNQFDTSVVNMAINARDAMNGGGDLTISVERVEEIPATRERPPTAGRFVAVSIRDTGGGIAAEELDRIFEPFFTTKGVGKGTGLGLSQVFGFSRQSNGEIRVESEVAKGTTFTLYLPEAAAGARIAAADERPVRDLSRRFRLLVVEDNEDVGRFATDALAELGHETHLAASADEALAILRQDPARFDLVFSDVVMSGMDGIEFGREVNRRYPGLPVLLTSGYSHVLAEQGTSGFALLHKPYSMDELSRALDTAAQSGAAAS